MNPDHAGASEPLRSQSHRSKSLAMLLALEVLHHGRSTMALKTLGLPGAVTLYRRLGLRYFLASRCDLMSFHPHSIEIPTGMSLSQNILL